MVVARFKAINPRSTINSLLNWIILALLEGRKPTTELLEKHASIILLLLINIQELMSYDRAIVNACPS